ncbi:hypothetical protein A2U01_0093478, partial [Trifolium medium]|nr:hypothetical protein [Trifolium medium]
MVPLPLAFGRLFYGFAKVLSWIHKFEFSDSSLPPSHTRQNSSMEEAGLGCDVGLRFSGS